MRAYFIILKGKDLSDAGSRTSFPSIFIVWPLRARLEDATIKKGNVCSRIQQMMFFKKKCCGTLAGSQGIMI